MVKEKVTIKNSIAFLQGNFRYKLFYSKYFHWLMRDHIREQIEYRINSMNRECFENGSCIKCGCQTTHLQMANKACKGNCYPKMFKKSFWKGMKRLNKNGNIFSYKGFKVNTTTLRFIKTK